LFHFFRHPPRPLEEDEQLDVGISSFPELSRHKGEKSTRTESTLMTIVVSMLLVVSWASILNMGISGEGSTYREHHFQFFSILVFIMGITLKRAFAVTDWVFHLVIDECY
jgi:hypothetical protein